MGVLGCGGVHDGPSYGEPVVGADTEEGHEQSKDQRAYDVVRTSSCTVACRSTFSFGVRGDGHRDSNDSVFPPPDEHGSSLASFLSAVEALLCILSC